LYDQLEHQLSDRLDGNLHKELLFALSLHILPRHICLHRSCLKDHYEHSKIIGNDAIKLCLYEVPEMSPEGGIAHFGFNIANFDEIIAKCKNLGVEILYGGAIDWEKSRSVYIVDPSGYEIELGQVSGGGL